MKKRHTRYEQGEYILLLFLPAYFILFGLLYWLQERTFFFTNNMVTLLGLGLLGVLLLSLKLLYQGIQHIPLKRLYSTDWFFQIILAFILLICLIGVVAQAWNTVHMLFFPTWPDGYVRQDVRHMENFMKVIEAAGIAGGAGIWLCGVHKKRGYWALCGAIIVTLLTLQNETVTFPKGGMMEHSARLALQSIQSPGNRDGITHGSTHGENNDDKDSMRRLYLGSDSAAPSFWGMHTVVRFYLIVLLCFTFIREHQL